MAVAIGKESFFWHKLHSLTGVIPVGFYVLQHLLLNSFSLAGPDRYNSVAGFFYSMPEHLLLAIEILVIYVPLLFHSIYGLFITGRAQPNWWFGSRYGWSQNRMYTFQRWSGVFLFFFLILHVVQTTVQVKLQHSPDAVNFENMNRLLSSYGYLWLIVYALGVLAAAYHLCYGIWNFCIRWGITIGDKAQLTMQKVAFQLFIVVTLIGWAALAGFFMNHETESGEPLSVQRQMFGLPVSAIHFR